LNPRHYLLAVLFAGLTSLSAQHKWDKDSIYLAEFGRETVVAPDVAPFAVHVSPFRALVGIVGVDGVPEQSLLLNHYGSYIYEEWIFENVMAVDLRHYWTKKTRSGQYKTRYVAVLNRFALTRWDYTTDIISNTLYTSGDDDVWNGASPWIPLDFDDLRPRYENSYRFGLAYGRRRRLPVTSFFKYREFAIAGVVRYDRWREQTLLIPQLKWMLVY